MKYLSIVVWCMSMVLLTGCASMGAKQTSKNDSRTVVKLMVLYPHPTDVAQFDSDYRDHLRLLRQKANIPDDAPLPYTVTQFLPTPDGPALFYQLFTMPFPSAEVLKQAMSSPGMQEVAADAARISSGGAPVVLVGSKVP